MKYRLKDEQALLGEILAFRDDPLGFVLYALPWGRKGGPLEHIPSPRQWQIDELEAITAHVQTQTQRHALGLPVEIYRGAFASGRGPGKSALLGMLALWQVSTHFGSSVVVAANTEGQLAAKTFPEFARWFGMAINAHWFTIERLRIAPAPWLAEAVAKPADEGGLGIDSRYWYVQGQMWSEDNPDAFAGVHNQYGLAVLFDEAAGIHSRVWDVTRGFFTEVNPYRFWLACSQMRRRSGRFFELFHDPQQSAGWRTRTITTRGMAGVDQTEIAAQIAAYGPTSDFVRVEIDGLAPEAADDQFIPADIVRLAMRADLPRDWGAALVFGVDPAPRGKTAFAARQGNNARDAVEASAVAPLFSKDNVEIAVEILRRDIRYKPDFWCVDAGMGTGVIDLLKRHRLHGRLRPIRFGDMPPEKNGEFGSMAAWLWGQVRDWLPAGMVRSDGDGKGSLFHQLTDRGWLWSGREDGKKILEKKEDLANRGIESPDDADALACTFFVGARERRRSLTEAAPAVRIVDGVGAAYPGW